MRKLLGRAIATYGKDMQLTVAVEELSELQKEICKHKRGEDNLQNIIEEIADCYIMLEQLSIIFGIDDKDMFHMIRNKADRLHDRLDAFGEET
jgi:NTP pyrophosphatase (non-canonical NTP hydrolase)